MSHIINGKCTEEWPADVPDSCNGDSPDFKCVCIIDASGESREAVIANGELMDAGLFRMFHEK